MRYGVSGSFVSGHFYTVTIVLRTEKRHVIIKVLRF